MTDHTRRRLDLQRLEFSPHDTGETALEWIDSYLATDLDETDRRVLTELRACWLEREQLRHSLSLVGTALRHPVRESALSYSHGSDDAIDGLDEADDGESTVYIEPGFPSAPKPEPLWRVIGCLMCIASTCIAGMCIYFAADLFFGPFGGGS